MPVKILLDGIPSLQRVDNTTQLAVTGRLALIRVVANKDVNQHYYQY